MQGDTGAQMLLADAYHSGRGVLMDAAMAYAWVNLSLAKFHAQDDAANIRKHFSTDMPPSQIAEGQKLSRELCAKIPNCTK
jgi:TPR repeat protein